MTSEWKGSVFSEFGDTDDENEEQDGWNSEEEVGESRFSEYGGSDEEQEVEEVQTKFKDWLRANPEDFLKAVDKIGRSNKDCDPKFDFLPEEARAFLKCIGIFRCGPQGTTVINNVNPPH